MKKLVRDVTIPIYQYFMQWATPLRGLSCMHLYRAPIQDTEWHIHMHTDWSPNESGLLTFWWMNVWNNKGLLLCSKEVLYGGLMKYIVKNFWEPLLRFSWYTWLIPQLYLRWPSLSWGLMIFFKIKIHLGDLYFLCENEFGFDY